MSDFNHEFDTDEDHTPTRPGQLSANGHWVFGSIFAVLTLVGFAFGVWAGASRPKPIEVAEKKDKDNTPKPNEQPQKPSAVTPNPNPNGNPNTPVDPKPKDDPKPMDPAPKPKDDPKPKDPEPKPKDDPAPPSAKPDSGLASLGGGLKKEGGGGTTVVVGKAVSFKEVQPILRTYCGNCHGLAGKPKGGVDVSSLAAIKKGDKNGDPILVPGNPAKSTIYESITAGRMPEDGKPPPPAKDLMLLHDWIAGGAKPRRTVRRRVRHPRSRPRAALTPGGGAG